MVVTKIIQTCGACPSQWEINLKDGRMVYVRFRWAYLSVRISENETNDIYKAVRGNEIIGKGIGDNGLDGFLTESELIGIMKVNRFKFKL